MVRDEVSVDSERMLADWARTMRRSGLRDMIALIMRPDILSLAGGLPATDLFPLPGLAQAAAQVFNDGPQFLQYRPAAKRLQAQIAQLMAHQGVVVDPETIIITTGAQQGLDMLTRLFLNPGGQVLLEQASYTGVQQAVAPLQPEILAVPTDIETGMDVNAVQRYLQLGARPSYIYAMSRGHNPTGVTMTMEKRLQLTDLARRYNLPIIEDDAYGFLSYEHSVHYQDHPLVALDREVVCYLGSFSKILAPALRLGWIVAPKALLPKLSVMKETCDLETSAFIQNLVANFLDANDLTAHIARLREVYRERRNTLLAALNQYFPSSARWSVPTHGLFVWVELSKPVDTMQLLEVALAEEQVAFVPGSVFAVNHTVNHAHNIQRCMRLNFSQVTPSQIEDGVRRIAQLCRTHS